MVLPISLSRQAVELEGTATNNLQQAQTLYTQDYNKDVRL